MKKTPPDINRIQRVLKTHVHSEREKKLDMAMDRVAELQQLRSLDASLDLTAEVTVVVGQSGSGKTTTVRRALASRLNSEDYVTISGRAPATLRILGERLLHALRYPVVRSQSESATWALVTNQLRLNGIRLIWIDEASDFLLSRNSVEIDKIASTLKGLTNKEDGALSIVLSGTTRLLNLLDADDQLRRRTRVIPFASLKCPQDRSMVAAIVGELAMQGDLLIDPTLDLDGLVPRIVHSGHYELGNVVVAIQNAVRFALIRGDGTLSLQDFAVSYADKKAVGREQNPFLAENFLRIDTTSTTHIATGTERLGSFSERNKP